ncbi:replication restart helicase PriA [Thermovibrio sp.]
MFVEVLLDLPVEQTFTYKLSGLETYPPEVGKRVLVPFGSSDRLKTGIIVSLKEEVGEVEFQIKEVFDVPDSFPVVRPWQIEVCKWIASFYCSSLGQALFRFIPRGFLVEESVLISLKGLPEGLELTPYQRRLVDELKNSATGSLKLSTLRRRLKEVKSLPSLISSLVKKGVLERLTVIEGEKVPKETFLRLLSDCKYRGEKGKKLLELLKQREELPLKEAKKLGFSDSVIKNLIERGCVEVFYKRVPLKEREFFLSDDRKVSLTSSQKKVFLELLKGSGPFLLRGITGSGKMEVYLQVAREVVKEGKEVLILVPELLLTPELQARVSSYFKGSFAVYHGKLTERERCSVWLKVLNGSVRVVLATRIGALLPFKNLGLIVVDEEQDPSYKEQQVPYYNGREVARELSKRLGSKLILVSATPSVETVYLARKGKLKELHLKWKFSALPPTKIDVVNLSTEKRKGIFTEKLLRLVKETVERGEQALLYIPRRGFFSTVICYSCGWSAQCRYCKVNLTYHKSYNQLICHICGRRYRPFFKCPKCSSRLTYQGYGTERVEEEIKALFPSFKVARLDLDAVRDPVKGALLIKEIKEGRVDLIVGTNIAIKGHNFPDLTFVGILVAELLSGAPDFKAPERIFQSIIQAAGRAGRFKPGRALVQAFNPELPPVKFASTYDYEAFYKEELLTRELLGYPPFQLGVLLEFQVEKLSLLKELRDRYEVLSLKLKELFNFSKLSPAPIPKLSGKYRYQAFITTPYENHLEKLKKLKVLTFKLFPQNKIAYKIDVEPVRII